MAISMSGPHQVLSLKLPATAGGDKGFLVLRFQGTEHGCAPSGVIVLEVNRRRR